MVVHCHLLKGNAKALVDIVMATAREKLDNTGAVSGSKYGATLDNIVMPADRVVAEIEEKQQRYLLLVIICHSSLSTVSAFPSVSMKPVY